jgi:tRNA U34 5-methylaminomethyl-2-thiouridine-forming methyltransferase MnmC
MIWPGCVSEPRPALVRRSTADGSFSLWSERFQEGFHSGRGALREAAETFLGPSELARFRPGTTLQLVEVCVGTGSNLAALLQACDQCGLQLRWWGLEQDPAPLALALADGGFRGQWSPQIVDHLEQLQASGAWRSGLGSGRMLWGDARRRLPELLDQARGQVDLVWHDAFSPRRCPQLWTVEFLQGLAQLLPPGGRWISYSSAAAVRGALRLAGLELAALPAAPSPRQWSGGTVASPQIPEPSPWLRPLSPMERDHLASSAGVPYHDPTGEADAELILANRTQAQADALAEGSRSSSSTWRRRWGLDSPDRAGDQSVLAVRPR